MGHFLEARREGLHPSVAGVHPVPRRVRQVHARQPVADGAGRDRGADPRRRRRARLSRRRRADGSRPADGARLLRLRDQPVQPAADRHPRRRRTSGARRAGSGYGGGREKAIVSAPLFAGTALAAPRRRLRGATCRSTACSRWTTGSCSTRGRRRPRGAVARIAAASSARASRCSPRIDRPAVAVFGSARIGEGDPAYAAARAVGPRSPGAAGR